MRNAPNFQIWLWESRSHFQSKLHGWACQLNCFFPFMKFPSWNGFTQQSFSNQRKIRQYAPGLESCIAVSTSLSFGKNKLGKKNPNSHRLRFSSSVSPVFLSTSSPAHSSFLLLPLYRSRTSYPGTRTFKWKLPPLFFCPALSLSSPFTLLNCSSSQLSFPAVCLSTASPSSSTSPTFFFVCQPLCL